MPAWITPLLCVVWWRPSSPSRSSSTTRRPRSASSRAAASPTMPPPTTTTSCISGHSAQQIQGCADDRLGVDLVVLVELAEVAGLAEALHAQAGDRDAVDAGEEAQRVRVAVEQRDDRQRL